MKATHHHIVQDVYEWAGQERVGPATRMTKDGPDVVNFAVGDPAAPTVAYGYYPGPGVAAAAENQYRLLARESHLVRLPRAQFVGRLAEHWGELNTIHCFREGNTRAQFVFFSQLAENAGYRLDSAQFAMGAPLREEFVGARFHNQATASADRLAAVLDRALIPIAGAAPSARARLAFELARTQSAEPPSAAVRRVPTSDRPRARRGGSPTVGRSYGIEG